MRFPPSNDLVQCVKMEQQILQVKKRCEPTRAGESSKGGQDSHRLYLISSKTAANKFSR